MSAGNNGEPSNRHACASCKHQRRKCDSGCIMARYFPGDKVDDFLVTLKTFGICNMSKMLRNLMQEEDRRKAVESFIWEGMAWKQDPVQGPLGLYKKLQKENEVLRNQVNQPQIVPYADEFGFISINQCTNNKDNTVTVASQVNSYTNFLQGEEAKSKGVDCIATPYYAIAQPQQERVSRGSGSLIFQPNLLPKSEQWSYNVPHNNNVQRVSQGMGYADFYNNIHHNGGPISLHGRGQAIVQPNYSQAQQRLSYGRDCNAVSYSNFVPVQTRVGQGIDLPYHVQRGGQGIDELFTFQQQAMNTDQNHTTLDQFDEVKYEDNGGFNFGQR